MWNLEDLATLHQNLMSKACQASTTQTTCCSQANRAKRRSCSMEQAKFLSTELRITTEFQSRDTQVKATSVSWTSIAWTITRTKERAKLPRVVFTWITLCYHRMASKALLVHMKSRDVWVALMQFSCQKSSQVNMETRPMITCPMDVAYTITSQQLTNKTVRWSLNWCRAKRAMNEWWM